MLEFLPQNVQDALRYVNMNKVYELRLRADKPVTVNFGGQYRYLGLYGITDFSEKALRLDVFDIADCVFRAGKYSVYSVEEQLKKGFLTAENGVRIGIAGEYVFEKGQPLALRNFTSVCIRIPHEIVECGREIYHRCMLDRVRSVLIASPPGLGKTTILRDLARIISIETQKNILICDERGEIAQGEVGETCDVLRFSDKATAFEAGIRAMRPDLIITDELSMNDIEAVKKAVFAGVKVVASAHYYQIKDVPKSFLGVFERYVMLNVQKIGEINAIYAADGTELAI